jgi:hypothetical protein
LSTGASRNGSVDIKTTGYTSGGYSRATMISDCSAPLMRAIWIGCGAFSTTFLVGWADGDGSFWTIF